jgi:hypothetical protein
VLTQVAVRRTAAADLPVRDVRTDDVVGGLFVPAGDGPFPGVALFGGSEGDIDSQYPDAALLASHDFVALAVG